MVSNKPARSSMQLLLTFVGLACSALAIGQEPVTLESKDLQATLDPTTMSVDVHHLPAGITWRMSRYGAREFVYEKNGKDYEVSLADSGQKRVTRLGPSAALVSLTDFRLEILLWIDEDSGDLFFKLLPLGEDHQFKIKGLSIRGRSRCR